MLGKIAFGVSSPDDWLILIAYHIVCAILNPYVRFGLVSLFNGISTFIGYSMPNPFSKKNSSGTI